MKQALSSFFKRHPVLNFIAITTLFIGIEGLYSFCSADGGPAEDTRMCPAFADANFDQWFPYSTNQTLNFHSSLGATNTLTLGFVNKSPGMITPISMPCSSNASFYSTQQNTNNNSYIFSVNFIKTVGEQRNRLSLSLYDFTLTDAWVKENNISPSNPTIKNQFLTDVTLGGMTFQNVVELMQDTATNKQAGIYKIWIGRQKGLVAYELYPTLERFVKQ
jgi:hypothetical protein